MDDLINDFIAETREMLEALGSEIVAWENAPDDTERLGAIFRFVHTVKGNCGFFDLTRLENLSHAAEDVLAEVRAGRRKADGALVSAVLAVIDRIGELVEALEAGETPPADDDRLIEALQESYQAEVVGAEFHAGPINDMRKPVRSIRISVDLLDRLMSGVSDMVLARNELARRLRETPAAEMVEGTFDRVSACIAEMREAITRTRMQRMDSLFIGLPRLVRDLSSELNKEVTLQVDGGDVELDREMIEMIRDPLTHIVRNAIDHGIEQPADRVKARKPAAGTLRVQASQAGNQILIEICDDGRGIDGERLVARAIASGMFTKEHAASLTALQKVALIFEAGLSTAAEVTSISGRGVGMDVVRANIERIGGTVDVDSKPGEGVRLGLRVPLTLTIIPALTVSAGGQTYAIPRSAIEEIVRNGRGNARVENLGGAQIASIRDKRIPLVSLNAVLGAEAASGGEELIIVLKPAGGDHYALLVDFVHDHAELVVKPAAPAIMAAGIYAGTTLADDGSPILLLDPSGMAAVAGVRLELGVGAEVEEAESRRDETRALLLRTLGGNLTAINLGLVQRIEDVDSTLVQKTAGRLRVTLGDEILPLVGCEKPGEGKLRILRLSDGLSQLAYAFAEVVDLVSISGTITPSPGAGEVSGVTLIDGQQVELLDPHWLFGQAVRAPSAADAPVCAIAGDDPWLDNLLRPVIESAGYRVVRLGEVEHVDVVVASAETPAPQVGTGSVVRIRSTPQGTDGDDSVYRYDRDALLSALGRGTKSRKKVKR